MIRFFPPSDGAFRINRIRLEFKEVSGPYEFILTRRINRIRLEFKVEEIQGYKWDEKKVLIESDWNLKFINRVIRQINQHSINRIRLEFKGLQPAIVTGRGLCINRIRLEFKEKLLSDYRRLKRGINRIRLEFKGHG